MWWGDTTVSLNLPLVHLPAGVASDTSGLLLLNQVSRWSNLLDFLLLDIISS